MLRRATGDKLDAKGHIALWLMGELAYGLTRLPGFGVTNVEGLRKQLRYILLELEVYTVILVTALGDLLSA